MTNLRWKVVTILAVLVVFCRGRRVSARGGALRRALAGAADGQAAQARARPEGRRPPRAARADRRRAAARDRAGDGAAARGAEDARRHGDQPHGRPIRRTSASKACRRRRTRRSGRPPPRSQANFDRGSGVGGTYTFTMKPNIQVDLRDGGGRAGAADDRAARQRAGRHRAEHRAAGHSGDQILVQLPGVTDVERAKEIIQSTGLARAEDRRAGTASRRARRCWRTARCRRGWRSSRASAATAGDPAGTVYYLVRKVAAVTGRDLRNARAIARREQPAGRQLHAQRPRAAASSAT